MVGHITYMSDESMREKFGRRLRDKENLGFSFDVDFEVESYLRYRGSPVRQPLRRQLVLLYHEGDGLLRSDRRIAAS